MPSTYKTPGVYIEEISKFPPSVAQVETAIPAFIGYTEKAVVRGIDYHQVAADAEAAATAAADPTAVAKAADDAAKTAADAATTAADAAKTAADNATKTAADAAKTAADAAKTAADAAKTAVDAAKTAADAAKADTTKADAAKTAADAAKTAADDATKKAADAAKIVADAAKTAADAAAKTAADDATKKAADAAKTAADAAKTAADAAQKLLNALQADPAQTKAAADAAKEPVLVRIASLLEYEQFFGRANNETTIEVAIKDTTDRAKNLIDRKVNARIITPNANNLYYAMQAFFDNGGGPCYIVSVGPMSGTIELEPLKKGLNEVAKEDEVTLLVFPESQSLSNDDYASLMTAALEQCGKLQDRFTVMDLKLPTPSQTILNAADAFRNLSLPLDNLKYGAIYTPNIETIFNYFYKEADVNIFRSVNGAAETADGTMATYNPATTSGADGTQYALIKAAIDQMPLVLPPSPLVVGQYAKTDNTRGVWKAPANVALASVVKPTLKIANDEQDQLNVHPTGKSINAIRAFTGKGTLIWGGRTLAGNDNEWRYISVRRFFNMAEESIKKATEAFVFEPNDANTWVKVRAMIENFLILQWRAGALAGAKPEQAFYVRVGLNETMTALDILEGRMIIEIGMAVVRPAEFIILKFSHKMQES